MAVAALGVACLMLIGVVLIRERHWRRRFEILEREFLKVSEQKRRLVEYRFREASRHDD